MTSLFKFKNWEVFLILILIPLIIHVNIPFLFEGWRNSFILSAIFLLIWTGILLLWFYKIADTFKTPFLESFEIKIYYFNLIGILVIFLVSASLILLLFLKVIDLESNIDFLSEISPVLNYYFYGAIICNIIIVSRIIAAKKLQQKPLLSDYYKNIISFFFFPIGIFWIQKELNQLFIDEQIEINKKRGYILIGVTLLLIIGTIFNFKGKNLTFQFGKDTNTDILNDTAFLKISKQKNDSIFINMNDSLKADYISNAALQLYQMGNFRSAVDNLTISIKLDSLNAEYYFNRGVILKQNFNEIDSAINDMTSAIKINSDYWQAYVNRAFYSHSINKNDTALLDINKAIQLKRDYSGSYLLRGDLKKELDDNYGACKDWMVADSLGNKDAMAKITSNDCFNQKKFFPSTH